MIWQKIKSWWIGWSWDTILCKIGLHECETCGENLYMDCCLDCVCKYCNKRLDPF